MKLDFGLLRTQSTTTKKETCKLGVILSRKENLLRSEMNAGLPVHFLLLFKKVQAIGFFVFSFAEH